MRINSYYAFKDDVHYSLNACSRASDKRPFLLNCMGNFVTDSRFNTYNQVGRSDYYLLFVHSGELRVDMSEGSLLCTAGSFIIFPPEIKYRYSHDAGKTIDYLWAHFTGSAIEETLSEYGIGCYPTINRVRDDHGIRLKFLNMLDVARGPEDFKEAELSIYLARLLLTLAKQMRAPADQRLMKSLAYINSNYSTDIRISELARMENLSESRYSAVFRAVTSTSPYSYITDLRIASAAELLRSTDLSVKEIGMAVGYADPHFFSRIFSKRMGISPNDYRNRD